MSSALQLSRLGELQQLAAPPPTFESSNRIVFADKSNQASMDARKAKQVAQERLQTEQQKHEETQHERDKYKVGDNHVPAQSLPSKKVLRILSSHGRPLSIALKHFASCSSVDHANCQYLFHSLLFY